jgi:hypothetical protein
LGYGRKIVRLWGIYSGWLLVFGVFIGVDDIGQTIVLDDSA